MTLHYETPVTALNPLPFSLSLNPKLTSDELVPGTHRLRTPFLNTPVKWVFDINNNVVKLS